MAGRGNVTGIMIIFLVIPDINFNHIRSSHFAIILTVKIKKSIFTACQAPNDPARFQFRAVVFICICEVRSFFCNQLLYRAITCLYRIKITGGY